VYYYAHIKYFQNLISNPLRKYSDTYPFRNTISGQEIFHWSTVQMSRLDVGGLVKVISLFIRRGDAAALGEAGGFIKQETRTDLGIASTCKVHRVLDTECPNKM
jgi:hypothetical protein